jgi:hypothetical protein
MSGVAVNSPVMGSRTTLELNRAYAPLPSMRKRGTADRERSARDMVPASEQQFEFQEGLVSQSDCSGVDSDVYICPSSCE